MDTEISGEISTNTTVTATPGRDIQVMVNNFEGTATSFHTPAQARELAGALLRAADEADGREPTTAERSLLDFINRAGWDGTAMVSAVVTETRDKVATFIRANIDMQGLDFPDAESVAVWLEETA